MPKGVHVFALAEPPEELVRDRLLAIPGVTIKGTNVLAPANAGWLVVPMLPSEWTRTMPRQRSWFEQDLALPELQPWVPSFMTHYQREGVLFALNAPSSSAVLWHPTGSGKSLEAIVWLTALGGRSVFVTKASARRTIQLEFTRYSKKRIFVLKPPSKRKKEDQSLVQALEAPQGPPEVVIVGWEMLPACVEELVAFQPRCVVFDELHKGKSHRRWRGSPAVDAEGRDVVQFHRMRNVTALAMRLSSNASYRLGLTATLIPDRYRDLWGQLTLIHPGQWGKYWHWASRYAGLSMNQFGGWDDEGRSNVEELKARLGYVVHKVDYATAHRELPPKRRQLALISKADQNPPSAFKTELRAAVARGARSLIEVRVAEAASRKRTFLVDMVVDDAASGNKVVVFTGRHNDVARLEAALRKALPPGTPLWGVHGGHGIDVRDRVREEYMAHLGAAVIVGTGEAWGESLSLHTTDHAIFAMLPITPKQLWQWEGRFHRQGQVQPVLLTYLVAEGTYDERVRSILLAKLPPVEALQEDSDMAQAGIDLLGDPKDVEEKLLAAVLEGEKDILEEETGT